MWSAISRRAGTNRSSIGLAATAHSISIAVTIHGSEVRDDINCTKLAADLKGRLCNSWIILSPRTETAESQCSS
jgi:hypothetical protein